MTLGDLITHLENVPQERIIKHGFSNPHSYRGYYDELAFEPTENISVADMLEAARSALNNTFEGYKGGYYKMDEYTNVWLSNYGEASEESIGPTLLNYILNDV